MQKILAVLYQSTVSVMTYMYDTNTISYALVWPEDFNDNFPWQFFSGDSLTFP